MTVHCLHLRLQQICVMLSTPQTKNTIKVLCENIITIIISCLKNAAMVPFPKTEERVPFHLGCKKSFVSIFCECRLSNDRAEYVQCFTFRTWYHPTCANRPECAVKSKRRWRCSKFKGNTPLCSLQCNASLSRFRKIQQRERKIQKSC